MSHKSTGQLWWWIAAAVRLGVAEVPRRRPAQRPAPPTTQHSEIILLLSHFHHGRGDHRLLETWPRCGDGSFWLGVD